MTSYPKPVTLENCAGNGGSRLLAPPSDADGEGANSSSTATDNSASLSQAAAQRRSRVAAPSEGEVHDDTHSERELTGNASREMG